MMAYTPSAEFEEAAANAQKLPALPDLEEQQRMYGLFKHTREGPLDPEKESRPGMFDFKGKGKWDGRKQLIGMSQEESDRRYVVLIKELHRIAGLSGEDKAAAIAKLRSQWAKDLEDCEEKGGWDKVEPAA